MSATFGDAITDVGTALAAVDCPVLPYEPPRFGVERGKQITLFPDGITPFAWRVGIRLYVATGSDVKEATTTVGTVVTAVEAALPPEVPRSSWETGWTEDLSALVATSVVEVPREDGF